MEAYVGKVGRVTIGSYNVHAHHWQVRFACEAERVTLAGSGASGALPPLQCTILGPAQATVTVEGYLTYDSDPFGTPGSPKLRLGQTFSNAAIYLNRNRIDTVFYVRRCVITRLEMECTIRGPAAVSLDLAVYDGVGDGSGFTYHVL